MIAEAVQVRASDILIETMSDRVQVRHQIDGKWVDRDRIPLKMMKPLSKRIRIMAGMDLVGPNSAPARLALRSAGVESEWRVSAHTSQFGEAFMLSRDVDSPQQQPSLHTILTLQSADGWFEWSNALVGEGEHRQGVEGALTD